MSNPIIMEIEVISKADPKKGDLYDSVKFTYDNGTVEECFFTPEGTEIEQIKLSLRKIGARPSVLDRLEELCTEVGYYQALKEHEIIG